MRKREKEFPAFNEYNFDQPLHICLAWLGILVPVTQNQSEYFMDWLKFISAQRRVKNECIFYPTCILSVISV